MIAKDETLKKICRNYHLVENYMQARFDKENKWHLHHRRETDEMKSREQLIDEGRYYDVEPEELIFLTKSEHLRTHMLNAREETKQKLSKLHKGKHRSEETRKKISEIAKKRVGENNGMFGKNHSEEARKKMSENHANVSGENNPAFGKHWWNNRTVQIFSKECPGEGFVRGKLRK